MNNTLDLIRRLNNTGAPRKFETLLHECTSELGRLLKVIEEKDNKIKDLEESMKIYNHIA